MSEQTLIDADVLENPLNFSFMSASMYHKTINVIRTTPTIDPETLPIVQELRAKLSQYEQAEQEGRLVELPCKVGTLVFHVVEKCSGGLFCPYNGGYGMDRCEGRKCKAYIESVEFGLWLINEIGETIFLTREEAEVALKERE